MDHFQNNVSLDRFWLELIAGCSKDGPGANGSLEALLDVPLPGMSFPSSDMSVQCGHREQLKVIHKLSFL